MHNFFNVPVAGDLSYTFNAGNPVQITQRSPYEAQKMCTMEASSPGIRWTVGRLTANLGVRYDFYRTSYPTKRSAPTSYTPQPQRHVSGR